jgi:hypothetical protein
MASEPIMKLEIPLAILSVALVACSVGSFPEQSPSPSPGSSPISSPTGEVTHELTPAPTAGSTFPPDLILVGGIRQPTADDVAGAISADEAIARATRQGYAYPDPSAFLVLLTTSATDSQDRPISNRLVWIVRWDGLEFGGPIPTGADPSEVEPFRRQFVVIDATTGRFLFAKATS